MVPFGNENLKNHPTLSNLFVTQLDSPIPTEVSYVTIYGPLFAIIGLWSVLGFDTSAEFIRLLESIWPQFWRWTEFLGQEVIFDKRDNLVSREENMRLCVAVEGVLVCLLQDSAISSTVEAQPGTLALATRLYIRMGKLPPEASSIPNVRNNFSSLIFTIILRSSSSDFDEFLAVVGFNRHSAARALLRPMYLAIHNKPIVTQNPFVVIDVHTELIKRKSEYYQSLPSKGVMAHACDGLAFFITNGPSLPFLRAPFKLHDHIESLLRLLSTYFDYGGCTHSWMIYALQGDVVSLALKCVAHIPSSSTIATHISRILDKLQVYSIHRPILRRLSKHPEVLQRRFASSNKAVQSSWDNLLRGIDHAQAVFAEFDQAYPALEMGCQTRFDAVVGVKAPSTARINVKRTIGNAIDMPVDRIAPLLFSEREFLDVNRNLQFFEFLIERELNYRQELALKLRDEYIRSSAPPPYYFLVDYAEHNPPRVKIQKTCEKIDMSVVKVPRMPVVLPCISVQYGAAIRPFIIAMERSGRLFGWLDELSRREDQK
ncbi:hypothetical protein DXG01_008172 [Tephrocybe rancida]|nr:hypothetical protein DXG01_008172 [Tephrocybe rancida]